MLIFGRELSIAAHLSVIHAGQNQSLAHRVYGELRDVVKPGLVQN